MHPYNMRCHHDCCSCWRIPSSNGRVQALWPPPLLLLLLPLSCASVKGSAIFQSRWLPALQDATNRACGGRALRCLTEKSDQIKEPTCQQEVLYFEKMEVLQASKHIDMNE